MVFYAQEEAQRFGEGYVSTEHMLLGLVSDDDSVAAKVLATMGLSNNKIRAEVEMQLPKGVDRPTRDMTLTPGAKRVVDLAYDEARNLSNNYIGTEHLLLGLIREGDGLAGRVLEKLGATLEAARSITMELQATASAERVERSTLGSSETPFDARWSKGRYDTMQYRRCGNSGLKLPAISLGAWETFGGYRDSRVARECLFRAFDLGITHFDFANNYGVPPGNAESVGGGILKHMPREELVISSKAGFTMWPGPYGDWGSRKSIINSCNQSLKRMGLDYFDIFYSHRFDPDTPLEETIGALNTLVEQGKALYVGISNYDGAQSKSASAIAAERGWAPLIVNQTFANMTARAFVTDLAPVANDCGFGILAYCPLASGLLTSKYISGEIPDDSRAALKWGNEWAETNLKDERLAGLPELNKMAEARGQTLAQMSLAWLLHHPQITRALIGASSVGQIEENVQCLENLDFSSEELARIEALLPA